MVMLLSSCRSTHFEAYPFGVKLGSTVEKFEKTALELDCTIGWDASGTYEVRRDKRDGKTGDVVDRTPEFGAMYFDHCMEDSLKFVTRVSHNIPMPTMVTVLCCAAVEDGRVTSLNCIHMFEDFDDVSSAVRKYVDMLDDRYGHYKALSAILPSDGDDYSSLGLFEEGAFLWEKRGHRVEMFLNKYQVLREIGLQDLGPLECYELVLRYK